MEVHMKLTTHDKGELQYGVMFAMSHGCYVVLWML